MLLGKVIRVASADADQLMMQCSILALNCLVSPLLQTSSNPAIYFQAALLFDCLLDTTYFSMNVALSKNAESLELANAVAIVYPSLMICQVVKSFHSHLWIKV